MNDHPKISSIAVVLAASAILPVLTALGLGSTSAAASIASERALVIAVSPSSVAGLEQVQLTISRSQPIDEGEELLWGLIGSERCPSDFEALRDGLQHYAVGQGASLPYETTLMAPPERGVYRLCGYVADVLRGESSLTVTASADEATQARELSEEAAAAQRARQVPVSHLSVTLLSHRRRASRAPGWTEIGVTTDTYAHVIVTVAREGARRGQTVRFDEGSEPPDVAIAQSWSCREPGAYSYLVSARSDTGPTLTRRGHFASVSRAWCRAAKQKEARARERHERQEVERRDREARREAERRNGEARARREALERWERNCRAEGGTPITLYTSEGPERACRAPNGGLLPVPE